MRKQRSRQASQLSLFDVSESEPVAAVVPVEAEPERTEEAELNIWKMSRLLSDLSGAQLAEIRMRLLRWAKARNYPEISFVMGGGIVGIVQAGEGHWLEMLRHGKTEFIAGIVRWIEGGGK